MIKKSDNFIIQFIKIKQFLINQISNHRLYFAEFIFYICHNSGTIARTSIIPEKKIYKAQPLYLRLRPSDFYCVIKLRLERWPGLAGRSSGMARLILSARERYSPHMLE